MNSRRQDGSVAPSCRRALLAVPDVTSAARLIASWRKTLDAFGEALSSDKRYYSAFELNVLERELAADRRWLEHFSAIRSSPDLDSVSSSSPPHHFAAAARSVRMLR